MSIPYNPNLYYNAQVIIQIRAIMELVKDQERNVREVFLISARGTLAPQRDGQ